MKKILLLGLMGLMGFMGSGVKGQNPVVYSTGFEVGEDTAWTLVGGPNRWHIGSAVADSGSRSLYVSNDGGATNAYTNTAVTCAWAIKDLTLSGGMYRISYRWRCMGESIYDYLRVALVPDTVQPDTTMITTWQTARDFAENLPDGWVSLSQFGMYYVLNGSGSNFSTYETTFAVDSGNYRLVCFWVNDPSVGNNPPAAVDNIMLQKFGCLPVTSVTAEVVGYDSVHVYWTPQGEEAQWLVTLDGLPVATVTDTTYGFSGLSMTTNYTVGIHALCAGGDTTEAVSTTFHTGGYTLVPYSEDFNSVANGQMPTDWMGFEENPSHYSNTPPSVQQHELNLYNTLRYPIVAVTPLLQGPANRWLISFDMWMQSAPTHSEYNTFGPFELQLVVDTNHIDSAITLLTVAGGVNPGWHTYTLATDSLTTHAGAAWLLFRWRGNYCRLKVDNLVVQPLTDSLPHVLISGPSTVLPEDTAIFTVVHNDYYLSHQPYDTLVWHSTMVEAGLATSSVSNSQISIVYAVGGTDTLTAIATNAWGADTAIFIVEVPMCPILTLPYMEDFEHGFSCWKCMSTDGDTLSGWNTSSMFVGWGGSYTFYSQFTHGGNRNAWAVSPAIALPAASDLIPNVGITLSFLHAMLNSLVPTSNPAPTLEVLISTTGRQSTLNFTDTLFRFTGIDDRNNPSFVRTDIDLTPYAGQTVWIAFRFSNPYGYGNIWLDDIRIQNGIDPEIELTVPTSYSRTVAAQTGMEHPIHLGDPVVISARLKFGDTIDVSYSWNSTMVARGEASMIPDSNILTINYLTTGIDTITVVADNHFGIDTTTTTLSIINCTAITDFPYTESFVSESETPNCWQVFSPDSTDYITLDIHNGFLWAAMIPNSEQSSLWMVSPPITMPADSLVYELSWLAISTTYPYNIYISPMGCDETVCFTDLLFTDTTETLDIDLVQHSLYLDDYAGQTIRIGLAVYNLNPADTMNSLALTIDEISIQATDSVRVDIDAAEHNNVKVYVRDGRIVVDGAEGLDVRVYDIMGREIQTFKQVNRQVLRSGVYLVKVGSLPARKVVVTR